MTKKHIQIFQPKTTAQCYVCRQKIPHNYNHFCQCTNKMQPLDNCSKCGKCFLFSDTAKEDEKLVKTAEKEVQKHLESKKHKHNKQTSTKKKIIIINFVFF